MRACELFRKLLGTATTCKTKKGLGKAVLQQIDYDLRKPGRNYDSLIPAIKGLGSWAHPLKSAWIVDTGLSTEQVRDRLRPHIDQNDGLLVTHLTGEMAWHGLAADVEEWLRSTAGK